MTEPIVRCAIYTRKSSEEGLEQAFNSLDAQRESCAAYIESQKHQGWTIIKQRYDDGGFSGGTIQRPGLKQLLNDISDGRINTVIVYKVDRLTRSLADFAKIIEVFDSHQVSFVSVTQQFNTTSSMGRLTLNVLLSFAQFERELTGERIRDKLAASKKKGMWMGGVVPLGYDRVNHKLVVNPAEAETVREIFRQYLRLGCVNKLRNYLDKTKIRSKSRENVGGKTSGGSLHSRGALYHLLNNRIYIGEIVHHKNSYQGQHDAIVPRSLWDQVAAQLRANGETRNSGTPKSTSSILTGIVFDASGVRFTPTHSLKNGKRYRYYTSQAAIKQQTKHAPGTRIPAKELEDVVLTQIRRLLKDPIPHFDGKHLHETKDIVLEKSQILAKQWDRLSFSEKYTFVRTIVSRVVVGQDTMWIDINRDSLLQSLLKGHPKKRQAVCEPQPPIKLTTDIRFRHLSGETHFVTPNDADFRTAPVPSLVKAIARARDWYDRVVSGQASTVKQLSAQAKVDPAYVKRTLPIGLLSPAVTEMILRGDHEDLSLTKVIGAFDPMWDQQIQNLGESSAT